MYGLDFIICMMIIWVFLSQSKTCARQPWNRYISEQKNIQRTFVFQWVVTGRRATAAATGTDTATRRNSSCCRSCLSRPSHCRRSDPSRRRPCSARPAPRATTTSTNTNTNMRTRTHNTPSHNILSLTVSTNVIEVLTIGTWLIFKDLWDVQMQNFFKCNFKCMLSSAYNSGQVLN